MQTWFNGVYIALGYKGYLIKNILKKKFPWKINLINTGLKTMTELKATKIPQKVKILCLHTVMVYQM